MLGADNRVSGIQYIQYDDANQSQPRQVSAKIYILAGNAIETPRLLLMSKGPGAPHGVANGRDPQKPGVIGKYLMDHPLYLAWALAPKPVWGYRGPLSTSGIEVGRDGDFRKNRGAFRIEIGNEGWNFPIQDPDTTTVDLVNAWNVSRLNNFEKPGDKPEALFGAPLARRLGDLLSRQFRLGFLVEQEPEDSNMVTLANELDGLGLQRPQIKYNLSEYTKQGLAAAKATASAIFDAMGAKEFTRPLPLNEPSSFLWPANQKETKLQYFGAGHIVGTHRMGTNSTNSAVDDKQQSWDHKNLFLVGSGTFPTVATGNPTLTIAALCLRTADHIVRNVLK
jgi:choline dehydrogenase-like flavoprotein